ncbi:MAG: chemotaxis protein CheW [Candidatus Acidiferrales bacterium]
MKIVSGQLQPPRRRDRSEPVILFVVAEQMFAIAASAIHEIRSTDSISAAASEIVVKDMPQVRHRLRRGCKLYYVVNACAHFGLPASRPTLVLVLRNSRVAVLVDQIDRMETMSRLMPLPQSFSGPERTWYRGLTLIGESVVPVLNASGFLTEQQLAQLNALDDSIVDPAQSEAASAQNEAQGAALR